MARRFESHADGSSKFWEVEVSGKALTVRFGRLGTEGQRKTKTFASPEVAQKAADALVREKTGKGYVEASGAPPSNSGSGSAGTQDVAALLKKMPPRMRDLFGELRVLKKGEEPDLVTHFRAMTDGDRWMQVFESATWLAEEGDDGGTLGLWSRDGQSAVLHVDSEAQMRLAPTLVDHLAQRLADDPDGEQTAERRVLLDRFIAQNGLDHPLSAAARKGALKKLETPEARFEALGKEAAKAPAKSAPAAKKGPRPLARNWAACRLDDGNHLFVGGENFGGGKNGETFVLDAKTGAFALRGALEETWPFHLVPMSGGRALLVSPYARWENGAWTRLKGSPIEVGVADGSTTAALPDGSWLVFGHERRQQAFRIVDGKISRIGSLPEARTYDRVLPWRSGQALVAGGEAKDRESGYFGATRSTLLLDLKSFTFKPGPELPLAPRRGEIFGLPDGGILLIGQDDEGQTFLARFDGKSWKTSGKLPALETWYAAFQTRDGSVHLRLHHEGKILRIDPEKLTLKQVGQLALTHAQAAALELDDGRVVFAGGDLYNNIEAEVEVWNPADGTASALPGYERDVARQRAALEKYRAKRR